MKTAVKKLIGPWLDNLQLAPEAKWALRTDRKGLPAFDPGIEAATAAAIEWLGAAQDHSKTRDGGCARDYGIPAGWSSSYPETTGYIVPTMIAWGKTNPESQALTRARRMLDWLVSIQLEGGGFQGGKVDAVPKVPVTFNTGQILLGLAAGAAEWGDAYRAPMRAAADFLRDTLDPDGCWRRHATPFAEPGDKTYETHVSWGLFEAERVDPGRGYGEAGLKQVRWAMTQQKPNGWLAHCCLTDPSKPLTHTLGYALRGFMEAHRLSRDPAILEAAIREARGLASAVGPDGHLAGRLREDWTAAVKWACLTGSVQIAHSFLMIFQETGDTVLRDKGLLLNKYVRRTVRVEGPEQFRGAIRGSFPIDGDYGRFQYLNWAAKFFIDSNLLEASLFG